MKTHTPLHVVLLCIVVALVGGCATAPHSGPQALAGTWTNSLGTAWTIKADGTFSVDLNKDGKADAWGKYSVAGNTITLLEASGKVPKLCKKPATYNFTRTADTLHFTLVKDACKLRIKNVLLDWKKK